MFGLSVLYCTECRVGVLQNPGIGKLNNKVTEISATAILLYSCTPVCTGTRLLLHAGRPIRWTGTNPSTSTNGPVCWDCLHLLVLLVYCTLCYSSAHVHGSLAIGLKLALLPRGSAESHLPRVCGLY